MRQSSVLTDKKAQGQQQAGLLGHAAIRPHPSHTVAAGVDSDLRTLTHDYGHNFTNVPTRTPAPGAPANYSTPACPAFPQRCPFGGACHACPVTVQAKLAINQPGDSYEQEADRMAERVMRMPESSIPTRTVSSAGSLLSAAPPIVHEVLRSPGQPLDVATRAFMEPRFGHDFSQVRLHMDARAAESVQAVDALAYTVGRDVAFGTGRYAPETHEGQRLIAHELTHVVQQEGGNAVPAPHSNGNFRTTTLFAHEPLSHNKGILRVQRKVSATVAGTFRPDADVCLIHLHADERNALEAAKTIHSLYPSNFVYVDNPQHRRKFEVLQGGKRCLVDPNRIFSNNDVTASCALSECSREVTPADRHKFAEEVCNWELRHKVEQCRRSQARILPVIAYHNTESFNITAYEPKGEEHWATATKEEMEQQAIDKGITLPAEMKNPMGKATKNQNASRSPEYFRNFIVTTDIGIFLKLGSAGYNIVLQSRRPKKTKHCTPDDGSLSLALKDTQYSNIEAAKKGQAKQKNQAILDIAFSIEAAKRILAAMGISAYLGQPANLRVVDRAEQNPS